MGCDIHLHVEVKVHGKWEHYNNPYIARDYRLFAKLAGVRECDGIEPITMPRGLPSDLSVTTNLDAKYWRGDGHSHSWLSAAETREVQAWYEALVPGLHHPPVFGYFFGNHIGDLHRLRRLKDLGIEDARIVFWFDN